MFRRHFENRWREMGWNDEERGPRGPWQREAWAAGRGGRGRGPFGPGHHRGGPFGDDSFGEGGGPRRHRRGDIKFALLELLAAQPRHGYDLIKELENRYAGFYRPSPGSVYPNLQLLEDEGYLTSETREGKRVYTITDAGRELLKQRQQQNDDRGPRGFRKGRMRPELAQLRESAMGLTTSVMQVARHGTPDQLKAVLELLDATRREIYGILAATPDTPDMPADES